MNESRSDEDDNKRQPKRATSARRSATGGGRAAAGGFNFQHEVAALAAVHLLAGENQQPFANWHGELVRVECETGEVVDDIRLVVEGGASAVVQAKHSIVLSATPGSEFGKTIEQFVRHHLTGSHDDLLVLATTSRASQPVRLGIPDLLRVIELADPTTSVESVVLSQDLQDLRAKLLAHIRRGWKAVQDGDATDGDLREFFSRLEIVTLGVDAGGSDHRAALTALRRDVLTDSAGAGAAWDSLVALFSRTAATGGGFDRTALQRHLVSHSHALRSPPSYVADVQRLETTTARTIDALAAAGLTIPAGETDLAIHRSVADEIAAIARQHSILVCGAPGAGKSVALHDAVARLAASGPVVAFDVGTVRATTVSELNAALGLTHDLFEVFTEWRPGHPGVVVIDAYDAARTAERQDLWLSIIERTIAVGWTVVVSVRIWDLRHSSRLQRLFHLQSDHPSATSRLAEFESLSHALVDELNDSEMAHLRGESPQLSQLIDTADGSLEALLRNPFNLRLVAEVAFAGRGDSLAGVRNRLQLLDRYWAVRVSDGPDGIQRNDLARRAANHAVATRDLSVPVDALGSSVEPALAQLLSTQIWADDAGIVPAHALTRVRFAHHVLFDYSASIFALGHSAQELIGHLKADPDLILFARPSVDMQLLRSWDDSVAEFWRVAAQAASDPDVSPLVVVAIGDLVAIEVRALTDLEPIIGHLLDGESRSGVRALLASLAQSRMEGGGGSASIEVWAAFAEALSQHVALAEWPLRILVSDLAERTVDMAPDGASALGRAARTLLEFAWTHPDQAEVRFALQAVLRTAQTDEAAVDVLLRQALQEAQLAERGYADLWVIASEIARLPPSLDNFVEELYVAAMEHQEVSKDATALSASRILGLTSTRQQDYGQGIWTLEQKFPDFCDRAPAHALNVVDRLSRPPVGLPSDSMVVELAGGPVTIVSGRSGHQSDPFGAGSRYRDLLEAFVGHLVRAIDRTSDGLSSIIVYLGAKPTSSTCWRLLLEAVSRSTASMAPLVGFFTSDSMLTHHDLAVPLSQLVARIHAEVSAIEKATIERTILCLRPTTPDDGSAAWFVRQQWFETYVQSLQGALLETDALRAELAEVVHEQPVVTQPVVPHRPPDSQTYYDVDPQNPLHVAAWADVEVLQAFRSKFLNGAPPADEIDAMVDAVTRTRGRLDSSALPPRLFARASEVMVEAAEVWSRSEELSGDPAELALKVLLEASSSSLPPPSQPGDLDGDDLTSYPSGARHHAARGLPQLAQRRHVVDDGVADALTRLATDPHPFVRRMLFDHVWAIYKVDPGLLWKVLRSGAATETHDAVLRAVVLCAERLYPVFAAESMEVIKAAWSRAPTSESHESAAEAAASAAALIWVWRADEAAGLIAESIASLAMLPTRPIQSLLHEVRTSGAFTDANDDVRARSLRLAERVLSVGAVAVSGLSSLDASSDAAAIELVRAGAAMVEAVAAQLYFASGAQADKSAVVDAGPVASEVRLWTESHGLLMGLAAVPVAGVTHHVVELCEYYLSVDPPRSLQLTHVAVVRGTDGGYQFESLGADAAVRIVERLLADHREVLHAEGNLGRMREILDVFVRAGWPSARRILSDLEELFR